MPVPSLYTLAKTRLIYNIALLTDIGDLPFSFLAPIIRQIQNPDQLAELESNCPQILGETGDIWLRFIKRDIPNWETKPHEPRDPRNWGKVYRKLKRAAEEEIREAEERLKEQMNALKKGREGNQTKIVPAQVGYDPAARRKGFGSATSSWGSRGPAPPAKTGKAVLDKLRRGRYDTMLAKPGAAQMPAHILAQRRGVVHQAPERLLRMKEAENSDKMVVSKGASAMVAARATAGPSSSPNPNIRSTTYGERERLTASSNTERPQRATLPPGQTFHAPKLPPADTGPAPAKRKRSEPNMFMTPKRRRP
ncbi:hypothetical protein P154DRAFT_554175 [Amniculicola lignicola CBS 123094]|uniref:RNA polymerase II transcription factor SIII subunit A n=1 Tax=Amniculicola lignicola CBS 123094 TaxID=1392246 RepID=A0A6A5WHS3_9PLEO|nr:hypothetical protein P154DRAFT_554175 [Amniculicola lignicola CBS 123094]